MKKTIFKTIEIGTGIEYVKEIQKEMYISIRAKDLISKMPKAKKETIDLVVLRSKNLGFTESWIKITEIYAKAKELGYDLCPAEVGPALRLAYSDQEVNEWLYIAHEPITGSGGDPRVFGVGRDGDGGRWLDAGYAGPGDGWSLDDRVVFRLRKSSDLSTSESMLGTQTLESLELGKAIKLCKKHGLVVYESK